MKIFVVCFGAGGVLYCLLMAALYMVDQIQERKENGKEAVKVSKTRFYPALFFGMAVCMAAVLGLMLFCW